MALSSFVSNAEISSNPATGKVTGDDDPAVTQTGVITKLRDADDEEESDLGDLKTIWDAHDHDAANPTGGGGLPIGRDRDGELVRAIEAAGVDTAAIADLAITGGKTAAGALDSRVIADDSVAKEKIGAPSTVSNTIAALGSWTWTHSKNRYLMWCWSADSPGGYGVRVQDVTKNAITLTSTSPAPVPVTIYYYS
jgi:hypothetical protein